tara:strand:+ start:148 stop:489 length:342 start_codon:yes stop_codon:yes gene_type:complete
MKPDVQRILAKLGKEKVELDSLKSLNKQMGFVEYAIKTTETNIKRLEIAKKSAASAQSLYNKSGTPRQLEKVISEIEQVVKDLGVDEPAKLTEAKKVVQKFKQIIKIYTKLGK